MKLAAKLGAVVVFLLLAYAVWNTDNWDDQPNGTYETMEGISDNLFDDYVIALEVLGVLLTAAMIGALVIARPLGASDRDMYPKHGDLDEIQAASVDGATFPLIAMEEEE